MARGVSAEFHVRGYTELQRALAQADKDVRLGVRKELQAVAEPVRSTAERLAVARVRNIGEGDPWSGMRVGVTRKVVYVAPRLRGVKAGSRRKRRNLAELLMARAMEPALFQHEHEVEQRLEQMLDNIADKFNRG